VSCNECCMDFRKDDILLYAADNYNIGIPRAVNFKKKKMNESLSKAFDGVNNFMEKSKKQNATLWCVPGSYDYSILSEAISKIILKGGKLLYVTSSLSLAEIEQELNNIFEDVSIAIVDRHTLKYKDIDITVCAYNDYSCFHKAFDLVVLDERMIYIDKTLKNMLSICRRAVKENGKLIHITHLPDLKSKVNISSSNELITIPVNSSRSPIPEPLIVISRLLNESIPEMVIDTINWSIKENQKMLIFVPNEEIRRNFYDKLLTLMDISSEIIEFSTTKEKTSIIKLKKRELQIVISNDVRDTLAVIDDLNVIVMNADHEAYSKEILLNMSAMAVYHTKKKCGQVIFVVEKDCDAVNKTKESIRGINKIAWENGYIKK
jgi:late competence protein required for DNA uptake (superfamily II DNA/RNA helicase)